jgi:nonribosomal peptide synthetase DhbF
MMLPDNENIHTRNSLHGRFEEQARRWPTQIALSYRDQQLTYRELNEQADLQAERLRADGVKSGDLVALMLPRGIEQVVQVLAILKAGAGYVPIDPNYPLERVEWMIESSEPVRLLTHRNLSMRLWEERLPEHLVDRIIWSDDDRKHAFTTPSELNHVRDHTHEAGLDVAYIIFTSGSTGKPKGVMVGHHQVLALLDSVLPKLQCDHSDTWTLFHSLAFDFSVWELWGALTTGGRLCVVPQDVAWSADSFAALLRDERVTLLNQTPSAFYALTEAEAQSQTQGSKALSLRSVIFGGEALNLHQITRWWSLYPPGQPRLINMYGITETTVHVTWLELTPDLVELEGSPIGEAIPGLELYLLNNELNPVSEGEPGEIHVGGLQLALGYMRRPDLTASRFIATKNGQRLYRSGDLAVRRDGQLFYLGRADRQLKIRGFRIEPAEVEAAIETHPVIQRCAVLPQPVKDCQTHEGLLAFVIAKPGVTTPLPDSTSLRQYLSELLPVHCLPSECIFVDSLPLTINGKLDQSILLQKWQIQQQSLDPRRQRLSLLRARLAEPTTGISQ